MAESRTRNSIRNVKTGLVVQIVNKIMAFMVRTVFIKCLNAEYLGVNGLFTNVLTILSFAELGIGTAIIYKMYKPVANNDKEEIKSLMKLYKKAYNIIGLSVFLLGLCFVPFMKYVIKDVPNIKENIIFIYVLFLLNTSLSYFFTYKKSIIISHQKQSVINNIDSVFYFFKSIIEILFLLLTKNFIIYLIIQILSTFTENIVISIKANKLYPYLKDKNVKKLDRKESRSIFDNVKSLVVYQFGSVIMYGTDNILVSSLINVSTVGLYSNYNLIINAIKSILSSALGGITASVGNLNAIANEKRKEEVFYQLTFIYYLIYSLCAVAFIVLLNPFINLWLGKKYMLTVGVSIALSISFFIEGLRLPGFMFRTTLGLFSKSKLTPYIGAITNIVLSILMCKWFGLIGIFIATSISQLVSYSWIDPYLIHKYEFQTPIKKYFKKYICYFFVFSIEIILSMYVSSLFKNNGVYGFSYKCLIVVIIPNIINFLLFYKTKEFNDLKNRVIPMLKKLKIVNMRG